jgi:predicted small secreted protein
LTNTTPARSAIPADRSRRARPGGFTMNTTTSRVTTICFALLLIGLIAACNTTEGVGRDLSAVGDAVSDSAEENKGY